jgi:conjugative transfer region lipoprotein (TIGR03751 family)
MSRIWIERLSVVLLAMALAGCATNKEELLTHGDQTMIDIWTQETDSTPNSRLASSHLLDARQALRRPLTEAERQATLDVQSHYTRTAQNEIYRQFRRLPNPDLVMYIFPHLAGTDPVPVPGYSTVFPLYQRVQYALPGERVEDY